MASERIGPFRPFEFELSYRGHSTHHRPHSREEWVENLTRVAKSAWDEAASHTLQKTKQLLHYKEEVEKAEAAGLPPPSFEGDGSPSPAHWTPGRILEEVFKNMLMGLVGGLLSTLFRGVYGSIQQKIWPHS